MTTIPDEEKCIIQTNDGPIFGYIENIDDEICYKFKGIPYAKPPVGYLRFLAPAPIQPWTELKDCTKDAPLPLSLNIKKEVVGLEDCLYIEVSTPSIKPDKPLPVMFWIGCYGFAFLSDIIYDPKFINSQGVVFVRCGFRVGPLGFLSVHDFTAPGNAGLKDIVMALKWVQRNISAFGGDPGNVTLFANSSGAAMVHFMMLSPMATGLFHKAIMQSACALNSWSLTKNPTQPVMELAKLLGIEKKHKEEIIEELKIVPAKNLVEAFRILCLKLKEDENNVIDSVFKPCIEIEFEGQPAFLTRSAASLLKSGNYNKVPLIIGSNNIEAAVLQYFNNNFYADFQKYNDNVCLLVPKSLGGETKITKSIGQQLLKFYLGGEEQLREDTKSQYLQLISDYYFLYYVNRSVRMHTQFAPEYPVYYYIMNYAGEWSVPAEYDFFNSMGHSAEIPFLFGIKIPGEVPICKGSRDSVKTRSRMIKLWTNFVKYGNPTPDEDDPLLQITWDPVENMDKLNYLSIGSELTKGRNPYQERMTFWDNLHRENTFLRALVHFSDLGVHW